MLRAQIVALRQPERFAESPKTFSQLFAIAAIRATKGACKRIGNNASQVVPSASLVRGAGSQCKRECGIGFRKSRGHMEREPSKCGAPPRLGAAVPRGRDGVVEALGLDEV